MKRRTEHVWRKPTCIALGLLVAGVATAYYIRSRPEYSVYWFRQALETRNPQAYDACVDADAVALDLARERVSGLHGRSALAADPFVHPDPETAAMVPEMRLKYRRYLRTALLGLNFLEPVDHRYLVGDVVQNGNLAETTLTPDVKAHKPWRVRFLKQDNGLWKVVAIHRDN